MRNARLATALSGLAGLVAAYTLVFLAAKLTWGLSSGLHNPFRIARLWVNASLPVVIGAPMVALVVTAYALLVLSYVGRFDPVVIWAVRAWRRGDYNSALRRVQLFSWKGGRTPLVALLLTDANLADRAYAVATETELAESDIEDPTYQQEFARGRAALARREYSTARSHFERLYTRFPGAAAARYGLGDLLLWEGTEPEKANHLLTAALKDSDRSSLPHWNRLGFEAELRASHAWSTAALGNLGDFQYSHDEALRLAGQNTPVRAAVCLRLGNALKALGRHRSAREVWAAAADIDPHGWSGYQAKRHLDILPKSS